MDQTTAHGQLIGTASWPRPAKNPVFANPFFVDLLVVSTLFVVTALGYLVSART